MLLSTPMSKNTWTATSAALAPVWARRATDPLTPAATPSPSVSAQFTTRETSTLPRAVPLLVVSATPPTMTHSGGAVAVASHQLDYRLARKFGIAAGITTPPAQTRPGLAGGDAVIRRGERELRLQAGPRPASAVEEDTA